MFLKEQIIKNLILLCVGQKTEAHGCYSAFSLYQFDYLSNFFYKGIMDTGELRIKDLSPSEINRIFQEVSKAFLDLETRLRALEEKEKSGTED